MTDSGRVCLTCGSRAKLTSAHLVGEALQKLLPASHSGTTFTLSTPGSGVRGDIEWRDYPTNSLELQVKRLCEPCNRDWMGTLEGKTRDVIAAMAGGQRVRLDSDMTVAVAAWSCLVAMLRSTAQAGPWFFEVEHARDVRERNAAPPGWHVWLLRADERPDFVARQMGAVEESTGVPWLASYLRLGQLVIIVATGELARALDDGFGHRRLRSLAIRLHPTVWGSHTWPPATRLRDHQVDLIFDGVARALSAQ